MPWRILLQNWLRQKAQQEAFAAVAEMARRQQPRSGPTHGEDGDDAQPPRCDVGLVFALAIESGGLQDLLDGLLATRAGELTFRHGGLAGRGVTIVESGVGPQRAAAGTEALIAGHQPAWVISAGFAGGLDERLRLNDIVMAESVVNTDGGRLSLDLKISPQEVARTAGLHVGRLLTVDRIVSTAQQKRSLAADHGALAVDMETYGVAEICRRHKVRFLAVRVISDTVDDELPPDLERLVEPGSLARRIGAVAGTLWRRPSSVKDMLQLKQRALEASDRLAAFLAGVISQLPPSAGASGASPALEDPAAPSRQPAADE